MKKRISIFFINMLIIFSTFSQEVLIKYSADNNYILTERTDLRRYDNGKYKGLFSREVKAFIVPELKDDNLQYQGYFYVNQETKRASNIVFSGIHDAINSSFVITPDGEFSMIEDCGFPSFRSFPSYPKKAIQIGDEWNGSFIRSVDPLEKNKPTKIKANVLYKYTGERLYRDEEVYVIKAQWATRYNKLSEDADFDGDTSLVSANGNHNAEILVSKKNGRAVLIRDTVDETFNYNDGNKIGFKGTISMFTEYPPVIEEKDVERKPVFEDENIICEVTPSGIKISLFELNFEANTSVLINKDREKLNKIAEYLKSFDKNKILIEGHTARVGNPDDEDQLSLERAHAILQEFCNFGLKKDNFICRGSGGRKPVSDNSTEEGRARNRRVEITILGDISK